MCGGRDPQQHHIGCAGITEEVEATNNHSYHSALDCAKYHPYPFQPCLSLTYLEQQFPHQYLKVGSTFGMKIR